jgi:DNA-directed RNA polymerase subunit RPC12/RpoP
MSNYISREEAMAFPLGYDHYDKEHGNEHFIYGVETYREWIESIPAAEVVEVVHGRWIRHVLKNANVPWGYDCSVCGEWFVISEDTAERYHYCPNCGAKMDGGADG